MHNRHRQLSRLLSYCKRFTDDIKRRLQQLQKAAETDPLTGLGNMGLLKNRLKELTLKGSDISVLMLNIDGFGRINNAYGIEAGDYILSECAGLLLHNIPSNGELFRLSGDEFALLLTNQKVDQDTNLAQQIIGFFSQAYIEINDIELKVTFSIGVARGSDSDALKHSFLALMESRSYGKNRYSVYASGGEMEKRIENNFYWQSKIRDALSDGRLVPYFQPILNNKTGVVEKFECLIRLIHDGKVIAPITFLESAKESGLLSAVTRGIISDSFKIFSKNDYEFSLNITEDDLKDEAFVDFIRYKLIVNNIAPHRVYFEILEGISTADAKQSLEMLLRIKALGCKLSVDDFGTEHSNFSRLLELQVDIIKIDGSFIKKLDTCKNSQKIVKAMVDFARSIDAKVVAEYVHSKEVYDKVVELGIEYSQGYYISEPKDFSGFAAWEHK